MKRVFGLHVTRTGGTSISSEVIERLGRSQCFLASSFQQILTDNQITPQEQMAVSPWPIFSYGHYVHESLWALLKKNSELYSFTLYRDPKDRIYSEYSHLKSLGVSDDKIFENLSQNPNPWCQEILRCFPSVKEFMPQGSLLEKSIAALSLFDDVKPLSEINNVISKILSLYDFKNNEKSSKLNSSNLNTKDFDMRLEDFQKDSLSVDIDLYSYLNKRNEVYLPNMNLEAFFLDKYSDESYARDIFQNHLNHYFISEAKILNNNFSISDNIKKRKIILSNLANLFN